jgi:hypothetical protein
MSQEEPNAPPTRHANNTTSSMMLVVLVDLILPTGWQTLLGLSTHYILKSNKGQEYLPTWPVKSTCDAYFKAWKRVAESTELHVRWLTDGRQNWPTEVDNSPSLPSDRLWRDWMDKGCFKKRYSIKMLRFLLRFLQNDWAPSRHSDGHYTTRLLFPE